MTAFDPTEKYASQIPAVQLLMSMGYTCLPQALTSAKRGKLSRVLLEDVLAEQILKLNRFTVRGLTYEFTDSDAQEAIRRLKPTPDKQRGLLGTNQDIYDLLLLGTTIEKTIEGDRKSYSLRYIDWEHPENNAYHVTVEMSVERTGSTENRRPDIVLFVNGIPFVIIENKAPTVDIDQGASQLIGYQKQEEIPHLFHYAQLLLTMNKNAVRYATVGTSKKYWATWKEQEDDEATVHALANKPLTKEQADALFTGDFADARRFFNELTVTGERAVTEQDRVLYALCRPERLLELVRIFTVYDGGVKKLARYQQFFGVKETMARLRTFDHDGRRRGGVIWHTQGSGKSLTMVMLGKALTLDKEIKNPRVVIVTDRDDLDRQIEQTFRACDREPLRATTGAHLVELLAAKKALITTIVNKFEAASKSRTLKDEDPNLFVLIDESHRSQYGSFAAKMRNFLPKACYIGFTGTPLLKKEKSTIQQFGGLIHTYTIDEAVADGAVVRLLYEGRLVDQQVSGGAVDTWFEALARGLSPEQKADLKKKFSQRTALSKTKQAIEAKAFDIAEHFRQYWQETGFKAQLVAPSKAAAIQFREAFKAIGHVEAEVIISPPDDREGNEEVDESTNDKVRQFWDQMMKKHHSEEEYNRQIIDSFKGEGGIEILIVVSKLLTGFDAPRNTVLYICRQLKEHNLLQAIARVNRLFETETDTKQYGYIMDYEGLLEELNGALQLYGGALSGFEQGDLDGVVQDIREILRQLPQLHGNLLDLFKTVPNKLDMEQLEQFLEPEDRRKEFYRRLREFGRALHTAEGSAKTYEVLTPADLERLKGDWKRYTNLRRAVAIRYQEEISIAAYEQKIAKLLDDHVIALPAGVIIPPFDLNNRKSLEAVLAEQNISDRSKADRIASMVKKTISERMDEDPALYTQFSQMLQKAIDDYRAKRISEKELLQQTFEIGVAVIEGRRKESGVPSRIKHDPDAQAFYGLLAPIAERFVTDLEKAREQAAVVAEHVVRIFLEHKIVNLWQNEDAKKRIEIALDDFFYDEAPEYGINLTGDDLTQVEQELMKLAAARFKQ